MTAWMERILRRLDVEEAMWRDHEHKIKATRRARAEGLDVPDPAAPHPTLFGALRHDVARLSAADAERQKFVEECQARRLPRPAPVNLIDHHGRVRALPRTLPLRMILEWLGSEMVACGAACDFDTAYQAWLAQAELVLRDADIGAIIARVHPERQRRTGDGDDVDELNRDLARRERNRVNAKRIAFGYRAG